jgi:hypothetical protein
MPARTAIATSSRTEERWGDLVFFSIRARCASGPAFPPGGGPVTTAVRAKLGSRTALASAWPDAPGCRCPPPSLHALCFVSPILNGSSRNSPPGDGRETGKERGEESVVRSNESGARVRSCWPERKISTFLRFQSFGFRVFRVSSSAQDSDSKEKAFTVVILRAAKSLP